MDMVTLWTPLKINEKLFIVKCIRNSEQITCLLSDFQCVWKEVLGLPLVLQRAKEKNPLVEYSDKTIVDTILGSANEYQLEQVATESYHTQFRMKYYVSGVPFLFHWAMQLCPSETFFEEVTRTLLVSLMDCQRKNTELLDVIRRKDVHIDQFQAEGASLVRKQVITAPFKLDEFTRRYSVSNVDLSFARLCDVGASNDIQLLCNLSICDPLPENPPIREEGTSAGLSSYNPYKSPDKNASKRLKRDARALRKFKTKTDAKFAYDQAAGDEDDVTVVAMSETSGSRETISNHGDKHNSLTQKIITKNNHKFRNKLNL